MTASEQGPLQRRVSTHMDVDVIPVVIDAGMSGMLLPLLPELRDTLPLIDPLPALKLTFELELDGLELGDLVGVETDIGDLDDPAARRQSSMITSYHRRSRYSPGDSVPPFAFDVIDGLLDADPPLGLVDIRAEVLADLAVALVVADISRIQVEDGIAEGRGKGNRVIQLQVKAHSLAT
jgi:hypothetical protein